MNVSRADALSRLESWSDSDVAPRRGAAVDSRTTRFRRDESGLWGRAGRGASALDLRLRDVAGSDYGRQHPGQPFLVIRHPEVLDGRQHFDAMAKRIEVPQTAAGSQHTRKGIHASFPYLVDNRLAAFAPKRPPAGPAPHVLYARHLAPPVTSTLIFFLPII